VAQRVYGLALGYEDLNDHEDYAMILCWRGCGREGGSWGKSFSGKSTLNRLELTGETASRKERYKKIVLDHGAVDRLLVEVFLEPTERSLKKSS